MSPRFLLGWAAAAGLAVVVTGCAACGLFGESVRSNPTLQELFLQKWELAVVAGCVVGLLVALYTRFLYRRHATFYAEFFAAQVRDRLKGPVVTRHLLYFVPQVTMLALLIVASFKLEFAWLTSYISAFLSFPLLVAPSLRIRTEAARLIALRETP